MKYIEYPTLQRPENIQFISFTFAYDDLETFQNLLANLTHENAHCLRLSDKERELIYSLLNWIEKVYFVKGV